MPHLQIALVVVPALTLLAAGMVPTRWANRHAVPLRLAITGLAGLQFVAAALAALLMLIADPRSTAQVIHLRWPEQVLSVASVHYDGVASLMLLLISFVGLIVCQYSIRYLDGDAAQGRYFRWVSATIGAVSLLVISGNLALFFVAWVLTSLGLHQLLVHYPDRRDARRAAWTKFSISRCGDVFLLAAMGLTFYEFGTLEFDALFQAVANRGGDASSAATPIAWLLMLNAVTKSAQFPFHVWLPDTMETPTPVSALMHAGIVNAGGYLVIRLSPLIAQAPSVLTTLAIIGTVTVVYGGLVMLTQTSVKRALAYSTIAQMGFMMMQCGLGAFSAALLHILAHSLYKAHAFLSSGSVLDEAARTRSSSSAGRVGLRLPTLLIAGLVATVTTGLAILVLDVALSDKPGGNALGLILWLAVTAWLCDALRFRSRSIAAWGLVMAPVLPLLYVVALIGVDYWVSSSVASFSPEPFAWLSFGCVATAFFGLFVIQWLLASNPGRSALATLQIHAANGFYVDAMLRRSVMWIQTNRML